MKKISIIVPVYNSEKYLDKCLSSLVNQSLGDIEIIIVNDGSTDNSGDIIDKYLNDKRVLCVNNTNHGIGYSRNIGLKKATGMFVAFIDSDDYIDKDFCEKMYESASINKSEIVICNYYIINDKKNKKIKSNMKLKDTFTLNEYPNVLNKVNLSPWNKIFKRKLLLDNDIYFPENLKYEDAIFVCKAYNNAKKISFVKNHLNYYLVHNLSETTTMDRKVFDILKILDQINNLLKNNEFVKNDLEYLLCHKITDYCLLQKYQKDKKTRKKFINDAFKYLEKAVPNYKNNYFFKKQNILKRVIKKNPSLIKIYCALSFK